MRFRRAIVLSLTALMAAMAARTEQSPTRPHPDALTLARLLRSVADIVAPAVEQRQIDNASHAASPQAVLAFSALAATPLGRSVWMVASAPSLPVEALRFFLQPLRC
jgi:hypothetical protein